MLIRFIVGFTLTAIVCLFFVGIAVGIDYAVNWKEYDGKFETTKPYKSAMEIETVIRPINMTSCASFKVDYKLDGEGYSTKSEWQEGKPDNVELDCDGYFVAQIVEADTVWLPYGQEVFVSGVAERAEMAVDLDKDLAVGMWCYFGFGFFASILVGLKAAFD